VLQLPAWYTGRQEKRGMAQVVALVDDLFFQAKLLETAKQLGIDLRTFASPEAFIAEIAKDVPKLVVVDLNARNNPLEAIERTHIPLIGFLSHVQVELAERARAAGCRSVMPRSQFTRDLATILTQVVSESS
jgi:FixJ family two-component response regulator